ncbi:MAG TPA: SRPBCC family protein [Bryobacteraceae bacterium]|nr:SRPBCC family protein [Bryobacteraceae bacterium]
MVKVVTQMNASRSVVYGLLTDFSTYPLWMGGCEKALVSNVTGNVSMVNITLNSMKKVQMGVKFECEQDVVINFEMVSGTDLKVYKGSYRLMNGASDEQSVMVTELDLDAGMPKFIVDKMTKKSVEEAGTALNKLAKSRPAPVAAAGAVSAAAEPDDKPVVKPKRSRCVLRVIRTDSGEEQVWYGGKTFALK